MVFHKNSRLNRLFKKIIQISNYGEKITCVNIYWYKLLCIWYKQNIWGNIYGENVHVQMAVSVIQIEAEKSNGNLQCPKDIKVL